MSRSWYLRIAFLAFLILFSCAMLLPTVVEMVAYPEVPVVQKDDAAAPVVQDAEAERKPPLPGWYTSIPKWMRSKTLSLGLDLQGGLMLRYTVDIDSAIDDKLASNAANIRGKLAQDGISVIPKVDRENNQIHFPFSSKKDAESITSDLLTKNFPMLAMVRTSQDNVVTLGLRDNFYKEAEESSVQQAVEIIRERIDGLGVAQPTVRVEAGRNITVELPGLSSSRVSSAEKLISMTAVLTFKLVAPDNESLATFTTFSQKLGDRKDIYISGSTLRSDDVIDPSTKRIIQSGKEVLHQFVIENEADIPSGREIVYEKLDARILKKEHPEGTDLSKLPASWVLRMVRNDLPPLGGENVEAAFPQTNQKTNMPYVALKFDTTGGDIFYEITKAFKGERLAILMDDVLVSDPTIRGPIRSDVMIEMGSGSYQETLQEVNNLVVSLRSGALPAPIRQESKTLVGPSLGIDSIRTGMQSLLLGFCLVFVFMSFYYRQSGLIASLALMLNVLFIMAGMASMGASLTMPGIAGIVLTVGMSVDANVIVFERIREELRNSETPRKAIHIGYDKALWAILDSNITTAIAAVVLMNFGSGPVKGFAVTLLLGIISTVYTAFFVTRSIFELKVRINPDKLSI